MASSVFMRGDPRCRSKRAARRLRALVVLAVGIVALVLASPALADPQADSVSAPSANTVLITGQDLDQIDWFGVDLGGRNGTPGAGVSIDRTAPNYNPNYQAGDVTVNEWSSGSISVTFRPGFLDRYDARYIDDIRGPISVTPDVPVYMPGPEEDIPVPPATDDGPHITGVSVPREGRPGNTVVIEGTNLDQLGYNGTVAVNFSGVRLVSWDRSGNPNIPANQLQIDEYSRTRIAVTLSNDLLGSRVATIVETPGPVDFTLPFPGVYIPAVGEPIDTTPPTVTFTSPADGSVFTQGQIVPFTATVVEDYQLQGVSARVLETNKNVRFRNGTGTLPTDQIGTFTLQIEANDTFLHITDVSIRYTVQAPANPDADGDGVIDSIETTAGAFSDGATTGLIQDAAGHAVTVADAAAPDGVHITVSGTGATPSIFRVCAGFTLKLPAPSDVVVTCGSVTVAVTAGPAEIDLADGTVVTIPTGVTAKVWDTGGGGYTVLNLGGGTVTVTRGGATSSVAAGQTVALDTSPPVIAASVVGTLGTNGWFRSNVSVTWTVVDGQSAVTARTGCTTTSVVADTTGRTFTCSATSAGGSTTQSVTVKRDVTAPAATYAAHPSAYTVDQVVSIACNASDAVSGLASPCPGVTGPAWTFPLGSMTRSVTVTDLAGNSRTISTSFTVGVTGLSLCNLTRQFVQGSAKYASSTKAQRAAADVITALGCVASDAVTGKTPAKQKATLVAAYKASVTALAQAGWLTSAQAATLSALANAL